MIIGIDVGGTHADGVLLQGSSIVGKNKVSVDHDNLSESIIFLLSSLLPEKREELDRIHLSTTLCTNALVSDKLDPVGMLVQAGPGINPDFLQCGDHIYFLSGAIDHRGKVIRGPVTGEVDEARADLQGNNVHSIGIATKFSHRNSTHELWLRDRLKNDFPHISMGHQLSGMPHFPRRVYTTWLNSALKTPFLKFAEAIQKGLTTLGVNCPCYVLKADGGTMPFAGGCDFPCQSIHSGPSASIMGALAVVGGERDTILLDIGGTTTDIALLADGIPLLEPYGATVAGRPTLIRALQTKSIGLGGDSMVSWRDGRFQIGPERQGPPMAFGGSAPTPTDAMVVQGTLAAGKRSLAEKAMLTLRPDASPLETSSQLLTACSDQIFAAAEEMIEEIFSRPVYTVSAFLEREKNCPEQLIVIGGPAQALQESLAERFGLSTLVPPDYEVANAVGAARARLTLQASLYSDTALGKMSIPEISLMADVTRRFGLHEAETRLFDAITMMARQMGTETAYDIDFIERLEMNTVKGFATIGKIITLKGQIRPGLAALEE